MTVTKAIRKELLLEILLFAVGIAAISTFFMNNALLSLLLIVT